MLGFEWNALKPGDRVLVHDDRDPGLALHPGVVHLVQTRAGALNDVAIRLARTGPSVVRPRRQAVHGAPLDRHFECWRCDAIAERSSGTARGAMAA